MKFTLVCPIHNEEKLLPLTLPNFYKVNPDEVLLILDHCTDNSKHIASKIACKNRKIDTKIIEVNHEITWGKRSGYLRRHGFNKASYDWILNTDADIVLDPKIAEHLENSDIPLIQFGFYDYPYTLKGFIRQLYSVFTPWKSMAGLYAFNREAWRETEDLVEASKLTSSEDTHLILAIQEKYPTKYISTRSLNLRSNESPERDKLRGRNYAKLVECNLPRAIVTSFAMLRPHFLTGYIQEKKHVKELKNSE